MDTMTAILVFPHAQPPAPGTLTQIAPGVLWFRLPLPYRLDHVNIYLIEDAGGWAVLDTGLGHRGLPRRMGGDPRRAACGAAPDVR